MTFYDLLAVDCSYCGVKAGAKCRSNSGKETPFHAARAAKAREPIRTKSGKVLTDDDIQELADEAEAGYDVSHLTKGNQEKLDKLPTIDFAKFAKPKLPKKLKYVVRARYYVWCDAHGGVHPAQRDVYEENHVECYPDNWRRVYVETSDKNEEF